MAASSIHNHKNTAAVCVTVLATQPYSGYYHCCVKCMRKLREVEFKNETDVRCCYWCRRCSQQYDDDVIQRYCVAMTVKDQSSTNSSEVALFGETLNTIFGLPATQLHKYLHKRFNHLDEMELTGLIREALTCVLIGKCVMLTFPRKVAAAITRGGFPSTKAGLQSRVGGSQLIANGIKLLGNSSLNVLAFMENRLLGDQERSIVEPARSRVLASQTNDGSSFFRETAPEDSCCSGMGFYLESYSEKSTMISSNSTTHNTSLHMPSSLTNSLHSSSSTPIRTLPSNILSLQRRPLSQHRDLHSTTLSPHFTTKHSGTIQCSENITEVTEHTSTVSTPASSFPDEDWTMDETILQELIEDWENSQAKVKVSSFCSPDLPESELQFSEEVLQELQQNFEPTPHFGNATRTSLFNSRHSACTNSSYCLDSPELFSSCSAASSPSTSQFGSPELFESSSVQRSANKELHCQKVKPLLKLSELSTPSIHRNTRHSTLTKRTLLQDRDKVSLTPLHHNLALINRTSASHTTPRDSGNKSSVFSTGNFTPELF